MWNREHSTLRGTARDGGRASTDGIAIVGEGFARARSLHGCKGARGREVCLTHSEKLLQVLFLLEFWRDRWARFVE